MDVGRVLLSLKIDLLVQNVIYAVFELRPSEIGVT